MVPGNPTDNRARFDAIARTADERHQLDEQLVKVEKLAFDIRDEELNRFITHAHELESILVDDKLRGDAYQQLIKYTPDLESIIITIPNKLKQYVDDPKCFEEALQMLDQVRELHKNYHEQEPLIDVIHKQSLKHSDNLVLNICNRLDDLEESSHQELKILVNQLIRCDRFTGRDLRLRFLQARDFWFNRQCESTDSFEDLTTFFCRGLPQIFEEYKYIFNDACTLANSKLIALSSSYDSDDENVAIINSWLLLKTSTLLLSLEMHLNNLQQSRSLTPTLLSDTMDKCFRLTGWLASIGFDFSSQLIPLFSKFVIKEVKCNIQTATEHFETEFTKAVSEYIESLLLPVDDEILRISNMRPEEQPPKSIQHYPIIKIYCLRLIDSLRWIQATKNMLSPLCLCVDVYGAMNASLTRVMQALAVVLNMDNNSSHPILTKITVSFLTEVLAFISSYCELLFPEKVILSTIGLSRTEFKNLCLNDPEKVRNIRLNLKEISQPIKGIMPSLMSAIES